MTNEEFVKLSKLYGDQIRSAKKCPRCGGQLVTRQVYNGRTFAGRTIDFVGCINYSNGCRFSKKHMDFIMAEELKYYRDKENK